MFKVSVSRLTKAGFALAAVIFLCLLLSSRFSTSTKVGQAAGLPYGQTSGINIQSPVGRSLTPKERAQVVAKLLSNPRISEGLKGHKIRVLRVVHWVGDEESNPNTFGRHIASSFLFDYTLGAATRFDMDVSNGDLVDERLLPGHPERSDEEFQEAIKIIQGYPEYATLLQAGGVLDGGFIVDGPPGTSPRNRFIQMKLLTSDRHRLLWTIVVDLTAGLVASAKSDGVVSSKPL